MANVTFTINGIEKPVNEKTVKVLTGIITTDNPLSDAARKAVQLVGGQVWIDQIAAGGPDNDEFVVVQVGKKENATVTTRGTLTRSVFVNRMSLAMNYEQYATNITRTSDGKTTKESGPELEVETF